MTDILFLRFPHHYQIAYADLMKEIWDPDLANSSTSPSRFKSQIQRFAPRFMGYS